MRLMLPKKSWAFRRTGQVCSLIYYKGHKSFALVHNIGDRLAVPDCYFRSQVINSFKMKTDKNDGYWRVLAGIGGNNINKNSVILNILIRWLRVRISHGLPNKIRD